MTTSLDRTLRTPGPERSPQYRRTADRARRPAGIFAVSRYCRRLLYVLYIFYRRAAGKPLRGGASHERSVRPLRPARIHRAHECGTPDPGPVLEAARRADRLPRDTD